MQFSIVVPTMNRAEQLGSLLDSLEPELISARTRQVGVELLVCNDGAEQPSVDLPESGRWISGPRRGPAANRNSGIRAASGDVIVFLDDDVLVQPGWLGAYVDAVHAYPDVGVFEGKTVAERPRMRLDEISPVNETGGFWWTCNLAIRRALLLDHGLMDEGFPFPDMEDVELRERLIANGAKSMFIEEALVVHPWRLGRPFHQMRTHRASVPVLLARQPHLSPEFRRSYYVKMLLAEGRVLVANFASFRGRGVLRAVARLIFDVSLIIRPPRAPKGRATNAVGSAQEPSSRGEVA